MKTKVFLAASLLLAAFTWATISTRESRHEYHRQLGQGVIDALGLVKARG